MLSKKNFMVTMVTDEFLENRIILQKSVATIGFIWFFWFQKCILLYIFVRVFLVMRCIVSHIFLFRLGLTPTSKISLICIFKGVLRPWALFLKTLCIFSKNKATSDKVSYGSGQKCSKELKNHSFTSVETIVVKLQWKMCENQYFPCFEP